LSRRKEGAFGVSTGLEYVPGKYADAAEITALVAETKAYGGVYSTHMRSEGDQIEQARASGLTVFADVYPYLAPDYAVNRPLSEWAGIPPDQLLITRASDSTLGGKTLAQVAALKGWDPQQAAQKQLAMDPNVTIVAQVTSESAMIKFLQADWGVVSTDGDSQPKLSDHLGATILTNTMEARYQLGLDSYDRLFPNQDTMPKGGFGNLIALPLQRIPRDKGNTLFIDPDLKPYEDQWAFLAQVRKMTLAEVNTVVQEAAWSNQIIGVQLSLTGEDGDEDPWTLPPSGKRPEQSIAGPFPEKVAIVRSNLIFIEKDGLPPAMLNRLLRLAAFQNPEFYQAQKMRMSTFGKPRVIGCAEDFPRHIGLPRGCLDEALDILRAHGIQPELTDERVGGSPLDVSFQGELTEQRLLKRCWPTMTGFSTPQRPSAKRWSEPG
jgi:hypothetical protein